MPEGLLTDAGVTGAVHDDPDHAPEPSADAPRGWTWQRKDRKWQPRQRGPILWKGDADGQRDSGPDQGRAGGDGTGPGTAEGQAGSVRDPDPSWLRDNKQQDDEPGKKRQTIDDVPREVVNDIAGFAGLVGAPLLAMLQQADPYCGTALAQSFEGVVNACLPLICRSKKITDYFTGDKSDWMLWGKLALALRPFAQAVLQHHVLRTVEVVRDEHGQVHVMPRIRDEGHGDHLTPPPPDQFNYAA